MSLACVKEEPERVRDHIVKQEAVCDEEECVKKEPPCSYSDCHSASETDILPRLYTNNVVKEEVVLGPESAQRPNIAYVFFVKEEAMYDEEECLKKEPPCSYSDSHSASETDILTSLYTDHVVKDEIVLAPESVQRPNVPYVSCGRVPGGEQKSEALESPAGVTETPGGEWSRAPVTHKTHASSEAKHTRNTHTPQNTAENSYICDICNRTFQGKHCLIRHMMIHIRADILSKSNIPIHRQIYRYKAHCCGICEKSFLRPYGLRRHMQVHSERKFIINKPYCCEICRKNFTRPHDLKRHEATHNIIKVKHFCHTCDKSFLRVSNLKVHERIHTGEALYTCQICKKNFPEIRRLKSHEIVHSELKIHSCDVCNRQFRHLTSLKLHKLTHTGEKPYCCDVCNSRFTRLSNLNSHKRIHTGETPYCCGVCNVAFAESRDLRRHKKYTHA